MKDLISNKDALQLSLLSFLSFHIPLVPAVSPWRWLVYRMGHCVDSIRRVLLSHKAWRRDKARTQKGFSEDAEASEL